MRSQRTKEIKESLVASVCLRRFSVVSLFEDRHHSQNPLFVHLNFQLPRDSCISSSNWKRGFRSRCTGIQLVYLMYPHSKSRVWAKEFENEISIYTSTHCIWKTAFCFWFMYGNPCTVSCRCVSRRSVPVVVFVATNLGRISPEATGTTWRIRGGSDGWSGRVLTIVKQINEFGGHCSRTWVFSGMRGKSLIHL